MNSPLIQIVIPLYNGEEYIRPCLDSLKNQTYENWQAFIVDDCSRDGGADIVRGYAAEDPRFVLIQQDKNGGVSRARNRAMEMLTAEYTAFLDGDDFWDKDMLKMMLEAARKHDCDVVQCRFIYEFPGGQQMAPAGAFKKDVLLEGKGLRKVYRRMMTGINMNHVWAKLIKTPLIADLRFDVSLRTAEDLKMCIHLFRRVKKYCFLDNPMYHYRRSETSITGTGTSSKSKLAANRMITGELLKTLPEWGIDNLFYRTLARMRPYAIICSKVFRMIRERIMSN